MKKPIFKTAIGLLLIYLAIYLQSYLSQDSPQESLAEAYRLLNISSSSAEEIKSLIKNAETIDEFKPWTFWMKGLLAEKTGKKEEALKLYSNVNPNAPSYPDALLSSVLLMLNSDSSQAIKDKFDLCQTVIEKSKRTDLYSKLEYAKAIMWYKVGDTASAISALISHRKKFSSDTKLARESMYKILERTNYTLSLAEELEDSNLLIKEKEYELAEKKLKQIQSKLAENSQAKLETLLVEQELLRKTGKNAQADEILSLVSADGKPGLGDIALKKMILLNWNDNKQDLALENFSRFISRFPESSETAELYYIQGRIFEEQGKNEAARTAFEQALKKSTNNQAELKQKTLRNLAWSHYRESNYEDAASNFEKLQNTSLDKDDLEHAIYWKQFSLKKAAAIGAKDKTNLDELKQLRGYYSILAANEFQIPAFYKKINNSNISLNSCGAANPDPLTIKKLDAFKYPGLEALLKAEISWLSTISKLPLSQEDEVNVSISKLNLYSYYNLFLETIEQASKSRNLIQNSKIKLTENCDLALFASSFPKAYFEDFAEAAKTNNTPTELSLAIARSESGFDKLAISRTDARGLMQLMLETANKEGLKEKESLFDPKTNINLGTKHIAKLLQYYGGKKNLAVAAYNAGSTAVDRWNKRYSTLSPEEWVEHISYPETKNYVKKVIFAEATYKELLN